MTAPPTFASSHEYASRLEDLGFWWPYLAEILERHELAEAESAPAAGVGGTSF
jgi:hygromycin-B 7''-O-kinase